MEFKMHNLQTKVWTSSSLLSHVVLLQSLLKSSRTPRISAGTKACKNPMYQCKTIKVTDQTETEEYACRYNCYIYALVTNNNHSYMS